MNIDSKVSSLLSVLKLPPESDAFMLKRGYKRHLITQKNANLHSAYKVCFSALREKKHVMPIIWDTKEQTCIHFEDLPFWPENMVFSQSFESSTLLAIFDFLGAVWDETTLNYLSQRAQGLLKQSEKGFYIHRRYYISPCAVEALSPSSLFALFAFAESQNIFLEHVTIKHFTKRFNINLTTLFAELPSRYKWMNGRKVHKSKQEIIYINYAN